MPDANNPQYDVAISFLSRDEQIASNLSAELSQNLSVFVYSERQNEIAGSDGLEVFRQAFLSQSRVVVVLYREGYGKSKWTRVEEMAIKERILETGCDFLFLVTLDGTSPLWVPKTYLRLDYTTFADDLTSAIKFKVLQLDGQLKTETPVQKSQRMKAVEEARKERIRKLETDANAVVPVEWEKLCGLVKDNADEIAKNIELEFGRTETLFGLQTLQASVNCSGPEPFTRDYRIRLHTFIGRFALPGDNSPRFYIAGHTPQKLGDFTFHFDYRAMHGWCWRLDDGTEQLLTTEKLCEFILDTLLDIDQKVTSGEIVRRSEQSRDPRSPWS